MGSNYIAYINVTPDFPGECCDIISNQKNILLNYVRDKGGSILSTVIEPENKSFVLVKLPYAVALCQTKNANLLISSCNILGREYDVTYRMLRYFIGITSCDSERGCPVCHIYQQA
jgi:hypothetical protein